MATDSKATNRENRLPLKKASVVGQANDLITAK
jgi:hypothetical protein